MNKARRYANLMPAVIAKSCNKLLIGKTYWKSAALPAILHGSEVVCYTENQITKLQTEENKALRYTVNARKCTAISALRSITSSNQRHEDKNPLYQTYIKRQQLIERNIPTTV